MVANLIQHLFHYPCQGGYVINSVCLPFVTPYVISVARQQISITFGRKSHHGTEEKHCTILSNRSSAEDQHSYAVRTLSESDREYSHIWAVLPLVYSAFQKQTSVDPATESSMNLVCICRCGCTWESL